MANTHKAGLSAGGRIAWTHKSGLGMEIQAEYSPLPRRLGALQPLETYETHFGVGTAGPRFILGRGFARAWVSGGGGIAFERATRKYRGAVEDTTTEVVPVGVATTGIELHIMNGGGLVVAGTYTKTLKAASLRRKYLAVIGGLVFTFH